MHVVPLKNKYEEKEMQNITLYSNTFKIELH